MPRKSLSPSLWRSVHCGQVNDLSVAKHLVSSGNGGQGQRHMVLGDSMALSSVFGKGRASDSRLLAVARKWACISIAGDLLLVYRWIPSEFNVADTDSRRWENDGETCDSKTVRGSDFNPTFIQKVRPPYRLISDAPPWMECCPEQNPKTTSYGCKGIKVRFAGSCVGSSLRSTEDHLTRTTVVFFGALWRQIDHKVHS